ncbi:cytochrome P450 [Massariosphaeria phaeospora]|uniref:Cytochrome P450 n=1 Tax=Massariosphaeria phaeospora TaxID=100035 RepID=A0A7C8M1P2_9PLEO|nr:cytochrome P450 [Massariosphaeria phaeospora]
MVFPARIGGLGALFGILFHISIINIEFDLYIFHFIATSVIAFLGSVYAFAQQGGIGPDTALVASTIFFLGFNTALLTSIATYRLVFHRCRVFPGPLPAKITRFYATYLYTRKEEYYRSLAKMHATYGDYVRTGPREISILHKDAIAALYGPNSKCRKSTFYGQSGNDPNKVSINMLRDQKSYRQRRRAWDRGLSNKALSTYEPRIKSKVDQFVTKLRTNAGKPLDITAWAMYYSFDVMGDIGFGKDFNSLGTGVEHPAIKGIHDHVAILGALQTVPWLLNLLGSVPGAAGAFSEFFGMCEAEIREKEKNWDSEKEPRDIVSWLLKASKDKESSASPTKESQADDSRVVIVAGSDTTSNTLANALFYLSKHPTLQSKLYTLLTTAFPNGYQYWTYDKVKAISYIDDIINETLRLKPAVLHGVTRETPPEGIYVGDTYIPSNTNASVSCLLIQKDARWWQQGDAFVPERWSEWREEMGTDGAPYFPFQLGTHNCIGKNLAYLSLRTSLSAIVLNFEVSLAEGETGEVFDTGFADTLLLTLPPLKLMFTPREKR